MRKKLVSFIFIFLAASCINQAYDTHTARAEGTPVNGEVSAGEEGTITEEGTATEDGTVTEEDTIEEGNEQLPVTSIVIKQYPSKIIYGRGDSLDLSDMVVEGFYSDGTSSIITDYQISGFDSNTLGNQTVVISYQGQMAVFGVTVIPAQVKNLTVLSYNTNSITLTWDNIPGALRYEIYSYDEMTGGYVLAGSSIANTMSFSYPAASIHKFKVCAVEYIAGAESRGDFSEELTAATAPEALTGLIVTASAPASVSLSWNEAAGATGYLVYRSKEGTSDFILCGTTASASYIDEGLTSATGYQYKVYAYTYSQDYSGEASLPVDTSTTPAKMSVKYKMGDEKVRLTYTKVTGAAYYDIYIGDEISGFTLLTSRIASYKNNFIAEGLEIGQTYSFYAVARREYKGAVYESPASGLVTVDMQELEPTSTYGKYFLTEDDFLNSWAYAKIDFFNKNVDYSKSFIIPGLVTTNIDGFSSTAMCPQGITFAGNYLLQTAYDLNGEENSVIYVMDKKTKELLTTLILPSLTHAGGICYDGVNIWVPTGTKVSSIFFTDIEDAVASGDPYYYVEYNTTCSLGITASYLTYYKNKLWIGTYDELKATNMHSYIIKDKDTAPTLTLADTIVMPTRVQGAVFTSQGTLILSRSCQLRKGLRGYMRQLDVYRPNLTKSENGVIALGDLANTVEMPSMNEGIAIDGSYLYVLYESGAFKDASYIMDHICAFKLTSITKKSGK